MAESYYEPFLINPPARLKRRYRRNDFEPGMEVAEPSEMGIGIRPGHTGMHKRGRTRSTKRRKLGAKKAARTRKLHKLQKERAMAKAKRRRHRKASPAQLRALRKARAARKRIARASRPVRRRRVTKRRKHVSVRRHVVRHRKVARRKVSSRKRSYKRGFGKRHKRHTIAAYKLRGHLFTSPFARKVKPLVRLNPRRYRRNPFGEELMVVGANPRRRKRSYSLNPRRRRYMRRRHRKSSKRMRSNPIASMKTLLPMIATGTLGALITKAAPKLLGMTSPWAAYGTQAAVVLGGGWAADKWVGRSLSDAWIIGGAALVLSDVIGGLIGGSFAGLGFDAFPGGANYNLLSAFPSEAGYAGYADEFAPTTVI